MACLIISGPSGAGKSTLLSKLKKDFDFYFSISSTTRSPREGEVNGVHYHFIDKERFEQGIENGEFLEYANVHDNYYGTSIKPIMAAFKKNQSVVFDIDVQGYQIAKKKLKNDFLSVFIMPPNIMELESRLKQRNSGDSNLKTRLRNALKEVKYIKDYDFVVINDDIDKAYEELKVIFRAVEIKTLLSQKEKLLKEWIKGV